MIAGLVLARVIDPGLIKGLPMPTTPCRECGNEVSTQAPMCPQCGAVQPYKPVFDGWGYEYKSDATLLGLPLVHVSFKYRPNYTPVVARGWLAIGQFSAGFFNLSQFGVGPFCVSQFALAGAAVMQMGVAAVAVCQIGLVYDGLGMLLYRLKDLL